MIRIRMDLVETVQTSLDIIKIIFPTAKKIKARTHSLASAEQIMRKARVV